MVLVVADGYGLRGCGDSGVEGAGQEKWKDETKLVVILVRKLA